LPATSVPDAFLGDAASWRVSPTFIETVDGVTSTVATAVGEGPEGPLSPAHAVMAIQKATASQLPRVPAFTGISSTGSGWMTIENGRR